MLPVLFLSEAHHFEHFALKSSETIEQPVVNIRKKDIKVSTKTFYAKKYFSLFTLISVTRQSFILVKSFLLNKGNDSLEYIQTAPR